MGESNKKLKVTVSIRQRKLRRNIMNEQTIKVYIKHNLNLQPIVDATVYWTEHLTDPNDKEHYKPEYSKSGVSTTDKNGIATIVIDIHESIRDGFNIPFVYYKKIWVSVDTVKCNGFKDSINSALQESGASPIIFLFSPNTLSPSPNTKSVPARIFHKNPLPVPPKNRKPTLVCPICMILCHVK